MPQGIERFKTDKPGVEILDAFAVLALNGGNLAETERQTGVPDSTLCDWRKRYPQVYRGIAERIAQELEARVTVRARELALNAVEGSDEAVTESRERLARGEVKDPAGMALRLATVGGIGIDKTLTLTGRPTAHVQHSTDDVEATLKALRQKAIEVRPISDDGS